MRFDVTCYTDIGLGKRVNQDSACAMTALIRGEPVCMLVLCDGMGGASMGEYASRRVVLDFSEWFEHELPLLAGELSLVEVKQKWTEKLVGLDREFRGYGETHGVKLGTTATCMLFWQGKYLLVQSGDSRAYQIRWRAVQLSEDQSYVQEQVRLGRLTKKEARMHPRRNVLTNCIGGSRPSVPVAAMGETKVGAVYLLCSDGLVHEVSGAEIACRLAPWKSSCILALHENLVELTELVKARGETDNITAVGMRVGKGRFAVSTESFILTERLVLFDQSTRAGETSGEEEDESENSYTGDRG